jgi:DNA-binding response OmpR family regulator
MGSLMSSPTQSVQNDRLEALVVDDSPVIRILLRRLLAESSIASDEAKTGAEALEKFGQRVEERRPYGLVFLDVHLPDVGGIAILTGMRKSEKLVPDSTPAHIVVLTSDDSEATVKRMAAAGADVYFLKPFNRETLGAYVENRFGQTNTPGETAL